MLETPIAYNQSQTAQIRAYLDDPLDPHAVAALRPLAYRKSVVMAYIDNLLAWGDTLFSQYTRESVGEARMLYLLAQSLLGRRPQGEAPRALPPAQDYRRLSAQDGEAYDFLLLASDRDPLPASAIHGSLSGLSYFALPPSDELRALFDSVEDRLQKIRHGLDIHGVAQALPLLAPPLDPAALVRAVAGGDSVTAGLPGGGVTEVPHYRFSFLLDKAQWLVRRLGELGSELLGALEKRDAEELNQLQVRQEGLILKMTREVRLAQLGEAQHNRESLTHALANAQKRQKEYKDWVSDGMSDAERSQISLLTMASFTHLLAAVWHPVGAMAAISPNGYFGVFLAGISQGGENLSKFATSLASAAAEAATAGQILADIVGIVAQHKRAENEWALQRDLAAHDGAQIQAQQAAAEMQIAAAQQDLAVADRQIEHNASVARFYREKFASRDLYEWMAGRLSALYYQAYQLGLAYARAAERAFQFERGLPERDVAFIQSNHWDGQRKGILAGLSLAVDLDRMEEAYLRTDARRLEIRKRISLLALDPMAFLRLRANRSCEFDLGEALFDRDFPGHYCRQVKTISLAFSVGEGAAVPATLTQLTSRTVLAPDPKAVAFLLDPKGESPLSIRHDWKARQQIALSDRDQGERNNGLFELRYDGERYLPFEGTGAVSRWRIDLCGRDADRNARALTDVTIELEYTAVSGGEAFAQTVRGLQRPYDGLRGFDLVNDFPDKWAAFLEGNGDVLELALTPDLFPDMSNGRIRSLYARYLTSTPGAASFVLDMGSPVPLPDGKLVEPDGLTVRAQSTTLRLAIKGDKSTLQNVYLLIAYKAGGR